MAFTSGTNIKPVRNTRNNPTVVLCHYAEETKISCGGFTCYAAVTQLETFLFLYRVFSPSSTTLKENIHIVILFLEYLIQHNSGSTSLVEYLQYIQF